MSDNESTSKITMRDWYDACELFQEMKSKNESLSQAKFLRSEDSGPKFKDSRTQKNRFCREYKKFLEGNLEKSDNMRQRKRGYKRQKTLYSKSDENATKPAEICLFRATSHLSIHRQNELEETARKLCTNGKGISACDESAGTIGKRFEAVDIENTYENRRKYRQMLFETKGVEKYLSGVILDPETLTQTSSNAKHKGVYFPEVLMRHGIITGVKPHLKVYELPGKNGDTVMQGLDSLAERARKYYEAGARFAKWRSPLTIDVANDRPTSVTIQANMNDLARYALICQSEGLMPIVEPDISLKGTHTLEEAVQINVRVQSTLFQALREHNVFLPGCTMKSNMVNPGIDCPTAYTVQEIAAANIYVLQQSFPVTMKGTHFLSGGQTFSQAAARLTAMNELKMRASCKDEYNKEAGKYKCPWNLSFSWSAAIQLPLLDLCKGKKGVLPLEDMSELYLDRLQIAAFAATGVWHSDLEKADGAHPTNDN